MRIIMVLVKGGWLMLPILISSLVALAIIIERYIVIRKSRLNVPAFLVKVRGMLREGKIESAIAF